MKTLKQLSVITLASLLAVGCGGGSKSDDNTKKGGGGIQIGGGNGGGNTGGGNGGGGNTGGGLPGGGGNNGGGSAEASIQGTWGSSCIPLKDGSTAVLQYTFGKTDKGTKLYAETYGFYKSGDCSGSPGTFSLLGPVTYKGSQSTSVCVAENFSSTFVAAIVDGKVMSDQKFSETKYYNQAVSNMACVYRGNLLMGNGQGEMDTSMAFKPVKSKVLTSSKRSIKNKKIDHNMLKKVKELREILK